MGPHSLMADLEQEADLEVCCVCLDSLSSAPVVCLLSARGRPGRSCAHFVHSECAEHLNPRRCPLCRVPFSTLSMPISKSRLDTVGSHGVIRGIRRLVDGQAAPAVQSDSTAPTRPVVQLLAATCPVRQVSLETAVTEVAGMDQSISGSIGIAGVTRLLLRCGINPNTVVPAGAAPGAGASLTGYPLVTRIKRRVRHWMLKLSAATGTGIFAGLCGAGIGGSVGAIVAIPESNRQSLFLDSSNTVVMVIEGAVLLCQMIYYGARRKDLLLKGGKWGVMVGAILGWCTALSVVDPQDHGLGQVFWSGLTGSTLFTGVFGVGRPGMGDSVPSRPEEQVDIFGDS